MHRLKRRRLVTAYLEKVNLTNPVKQISESLFVGSTENLKEIIAFFF